MRTTKRLCAVALVIVLSIFALVMPAHAATIDWGTRFSNFPDCSAALTPYSEYVKPIQRFLMCYDYDMNTSISNNGGIDGYFGSATYSAVRTFQNNAGLNADGIVGDATWRKIANLMSKTTLAGTYTNFQYDGMSVIDYIFYCSPVEYWYYGESNYAEGCFRTGE